LSNGSSSTTRMAIKMIAPDHQAGGDRVRSEDTRVLTSISDGQD
jgi:hypothetical protein